MRWHAFDLERGRSLAYRRIPKAVRADHQDLLFFCAEQENSGVIRGAGAYSEDDWLLLGLRPGDVEAVLAHRLARWLTREEAEALLVALTPSEEQLGDDSQDRRALLERCRLTCEVVDRLITTQLVDRSTQLVDRDRHTMSIGSIRDRSGIDLVVLDFDLGGQVFSQYTSAVNRKNVQARWNRQKQLELLTPPATPERGTPHLVDPGSIRDRHGAGDTAVIHSYSNRSGIPPQTPPLGGRLLIDPTREEVAQLESFWAWFLRARPPLLNSTLWGGAKNAVLRTIFGKAGEKQIPLGQVLEQLRADLEGKFKAPRWVQDSALSKRGFRSYVRDDDWVPVRPADEDPLDRELREKQQKLEKEKRLRDHDAWGRELRAAWAEEMPGKPFPDSLEEAARLLREKHGWKN